MNLPGFNAEASLGPTAGVYHPRLLAGISSRIEGVIASRAISSGCGACTEVKWPNGRGTGACVQDCCDVLGNCQIKTCPCSDSGSTAGHYAGVFDEVWAPISW
jgi:hypothetical protein